MAVGGLGVDIGCTLVVFYSTMLRRLANVLTGSCTLVDDYSMAWQIKV